MYLKRLDLQGFKSFPDKVRLDFHQGITAVVGPNGSGKSNVSDSVRWVLGEQRAKSLRGEKMEDIIFAGTETRKPLGFAEVSITLDNEEGEMPVDYTEVTVKRRVYRSGESEYLINGNGCRLKDIHELFMDTGVGREGYSIIGQGRIEEILSSKSEDRRKIFEEAAGIVKYKNRKNEALSKLEKEEQNLLRVADIIFELEGQLPSLQEQSEKAKEYLGLYEEIKQAEIAVFCQDIDKMEEESLQLQRDYNLILDNKKRLEENQKEERNRIGEEKGKLQQLNEQIQQVNEEISDLRTKAEKKAGEIRLAKEQLQHFKSDTSRLLSGKEEKQVKIKENSSQIQLQEQKKMSFQMQLQGGQNRLSGLEEGFGLLNQVLMEQEEVAQENQEKMIEQIRISTEIKGLIAKTNSLIDQYAHRKQQLVVEKDYLLSQAERQAVHGSVLQKKIAENENKILLSVEITEKEEEQLQGVLSQLEELQKEFLLQEDNYNQKKSRLSILKEMEREQEGYGHGVRSILKKKDTEIGICGAVGQLLSVEKKYEIAMEVALGNAVKNIVTKTEEDAKTAIEYLKKNQLGRATFLPISAVRGKTIGKERDTLLQEKGVLGIAAELVTAEPVYEEIVKTLLGRILVMNDLDSAILLAKKYKYQYKIVTLSGEILTTGGAMTGGGVARKTSNVFGRARELKELSEALDDADKKLYQLKSKKLMLKEAQKELETSLIQKKIELQEMKLTIVSLQREWETLQDNKKEGEEKLSAYQEEDKILIQQEEKVHEEKSVLLKQYAEAEENVCGFNETLSSFRENVVGEKTKKEELLHEITELRIGISDIRQGEAVATETIKRMEMENRELQEGCLRIDQQLRSLEEEKQEKAKQEVLMALEIDGCQLEENEKKEELHHIIEKRKAVSETIEVIEAENRSDMEQLSKVENQLFRIEARLEKGKEERQRLFQRMWEEYELTYQLAKEQRKIDGSYSQLKNQVKEGKIAIKNLGEVHVGAMTQYQERKQRYDFLMLQKQDIEDAEEKLRRIIDELSEQMKVQFQEQFALISENFNEVFQEMFGGGKAYLKLSDESNILESPIEIIAQPPGKSLQNMMLLSGGERALTAISILFSILKMKPSPFCILDEIEAALDDANVKRYAKYLTRFAENTQFIVITHRKGAMEVADRMYGVTMQEKGVSKLISVNFEEAK